MTRWSMNVKNETQIDIVTKHIYCYLHQLHWIHYTPYNRVNSWRKFELASHLICFCRLLYTKRANLGAWEKKDINIVMYNRAHHVGSRVYQCHSRRCSISMQRLEGRNQACRCWWVEGGHAASLETCKFYSSLIGSVFLRGIWWVTHKQLAEACFLRFVVTLRTVESAMETRYLNWKIGPPDWIIILRCWGHFFWKPRYLWVRLMVS